MRRQSYFLNSQTRFAFRRRFEQGARRRLSDRHHRFRNARGGCCLQGISSSFKNQARGVCLEHVRGNLRRFLFQFLNGDQHRSPAHCCGATAERADAVLHNRSVSVNDRNIIEIHTELISGDLCKRRFLALAMRRRAGHDRNLAGRFYAHSRAFPTACRHGLRWTKRANFDVTGHADAD